MPVRNEESDNEDLKSVETDGQVEEISFSYLAAHPSVSIWKRKLYSLLAGESDETLYRLGSIEQYIRVVLAESETTDAEYYFQEALAEVVQSWNPNVFESADRLNRILSLIAAFTPTVGFGKVLANLERSQNVKRSAEQISDENSPVDLYKKGLIALGQYYLTPPFHSHEDFGFSAYRALLERNLKDELYSGYAAVKLLQLKVLNIRSRRFTSLLLSSANAGVEVFRALLTLAQTPTEVETASRRLGDVLVICARANKIEVFEELARMNGASFDAEGDYEIFFPTLTLANGQVLQILLSMQDVKDTALRHYITYSCNKVRELFSCVPLNERRISRYISGYLTQLISDVDALNALADELAARKAQITVLHNEFVITAIRDNAPIEIGLELESKVETELVKWWVKKTPIQITTTQSEWFSRVSTA